MSINFLGALMSGWIPVFDTMHGIRGELNVIVKVELFADFNKYKTSSCGVQFFHCKYFTLYNELIFKSFLMYVFSDFKFYLRVKVVGITS